MMKLTVTKLISAIFFSFFHLCMQAQGNRLQCDESCAPGATGAVKYNVVSPVGFSTVDPIEMAPRLTSLNGKTIAIVGEDFMNNITHPELRRSALLSTYIRESADLSGIYRPYLERDHRRAATSLPQHYNMACGSQRLHGRL